ncbi:Adenosylhomocysteinase [Candidatus Gugararchaeum adminiculabundum]|nr:Adenosylhomocysteinase [Candidatus Gugararchaeum adminiculabundum]
MSKVKNEKLAAEGDRELEWARVNMPVLAQIRKDFERDKPLKGLTIGTALHLEKKTGILLETLAAGGAKVFCSSCNPLTTDDRVAAALAKQPNMNVFAWAGQTKDEYYSCLNSVLDGSPDIVIDDGCDLIFAIHEKRKELLKKIIGGCEETTTGVIRLKAMQKDGALKFPVIAVNNAYSKYLFDNRFGTAQSTLDAISRATNKLIAGKTIVVAGYGWCGRGIASRARGLGANVIVVETAGTLGEHESGYHRALEALYEGFRVMSMDEAAGLGDIFITATGNKNIIDKQHLQKMKTGTILANAGHFNNEINEEALNSLAKGKREIKENVDAYELKSGKTLYLLSEGRLVNLARPSGQGHPIEIMDGSFAVQALSVKFLVDNRGKLKPGVTSVPTETDNLVARLALESQGIKLSPPTKEQAEYANSWKEGT